MTIIKAAIIPPKMARVMQLPCVGISGDVTGVVRQVAGDWITTTVSLPVNENKVHLCF